MKTKIKDLINLSAYKTFTFTAVFVVAAETLLLSGSATGSVMAMPAFFLMIAAGGVYFATCSKKQGEKA